MAWLNYRDPGERLIRAIVLALGVIFIGCGAGLYYQHGAFWDGGAGVCFIAGIIFVVLALLGKLEWLGNIGI